MYTKNSNFIGLIFSKNVEGSVYNNINFLYTKNIVNNHKVNEN